METESNTRGGISPLATVKLQNRFEPARLRLPDVSLSLDQGAV